MSAQRYIISHYTNSVMETVILNTDAVIVPGDALFVISGGKKARLVVKAKTMNFYSTRRSCNY